MNPNLVPCINEPRLSINFSASWQVDQISFFSGMASSNFQRLMEDCPKSGGTPVPGPPQIIQEGPVGIRMLWSWIHMDPHLPSTFTNKKPPKLCGRINLPWCHGSVDIQELAWDSDSSGFHQWFHQEEGLSWCHRSTAPSNMEFNEETGGNFTSKTWSGFWIWTSQCVLGWIWSVSGVFVCAQVGYV